MSDPVRVSGWLGLARGVWRDRAPDHGEGRRHERPARRIRQTEPAIDAITKTTDGQRDLFRIDIRIDLAAGLSGRDHMGQCCGHANVGRHQHLGDRGGSGRFSDDFNAQAGHGFDNRIRRESAKNLLDHKEEILSVAQAIDKSDAQLQILFDERQDQRFLVLEILVQAGDADARLGADFRRGRRVEKGQGACGSSSKRERTLSLSEVLAIFCRIVSFGLGFTSFASDTVSQGRSVECPLNFSPPSRSEAPSSRTGSPCRRCACTRPAKTDASATSISSITGHERWAEQA